MSYGVGVSSDGRWVEVWREGEPETVLITVPARGARQLAAALTSAADRVREESEIVTEDLAKLEATLTEVQAAVVGYRTGTAFQGIEKALYLLRIVREIMERDAD